MRGSVFHRTTKRSSPQSCWSPCSGSRIVPARTMRSLRICSFTFPTSGTLLHATGTVHSAARYRVRPLTVGRCGCVEGKRWRLTVGARISGGSVLYSMVGRRGESVRKAAIDTDAVSQISSSKGIVMQCPYFSRASAPVHLAACGHSVGHHPIRPVPCVPEMERNMSSGVVPVRAAEARAPSGCHGAGGRVIVAMTM